MHASKAPVRGSTRRFGPAGAALVALLAAGCSTLSPQIFSPRFDAVQAGCTPAGAASSASDAAVAAAGAASAACAPGAVTVGAAIGDAVALQGRYLKAVREQSELGAGTSAALIGLSALAVFKGVTHPNGKDLAGLGILGSATYVYGSTMVSRPRQQLYLAGAESLECAVAATRPYDFEDLRWVRDKAESEDRPMSLDGRIRAAEAASRGLADALAPLEALLVTRERKELPATRAEPPECKALGAAPAGPAAASAPSNDRERLEALRRRNDEQLRERCKPPAARLVRENPHPDVISHVRALKLAQRALERSLGQARTQLGEIDSAGSRLWSRTLSIQLQVAAEVLKTEPDITAVRNAAQGIRSGAIALAGAGAFPATPPASSPAAAGDGVPTGSATAAGAVALRRDEPAPRPDREIDIARRALDTARQATARLEEKLRELKQRVDTVRTPLEKCGGVIAQRQLTVSPADAELDVVAGQTQVFLVAGGSGIPSGNVVTDGSKATRPLAAATIEGAQFKLVYTPPDKAADGLRETVTLVDGSGQLQHVVHVVVHVEAGTP